MKSIYISGPITGMPDNNRDAFRKAEVHLSAWYGEVINPNHHSEDPSCPTWEEFMREDIKLLLQCRSIYMLRGWRKSRGAKLEYRIARALKMKVIFEP